ncbi:MAG: magnesium transporter CorA family protein [Beijerinckiaceae bacterium]
MIIIYHPRAGINADHDCFDRHMLVSGNPIPENTLWIDLFEPTPEEDRLVEEFLSIEIPTKDEMKDIEPSNLLYAENGARYMTARILCRSDTSIPKLTPISFIITDRALVTVRYDDPRSFTMFSTRVGKPGTCSPQPEAILDGLLEAVIDRAAEVLRKVGDEIELTSRSVFETEAAIADRGKGFNRVIQNLGRHGDLISNVRESMVSLERMLLYLSANMSRPKRASGFQAEWRTAIRDVQSIEEHAAFLSSKMQFVLDATLGMVSLEQNRIVKIFSVLAVIFMPPTLVASVYGMNFRKGMLELDWEYGYVMALLLMLCAAIVPYLFFRWKKWL